MLQILKKNFGASAELDTYQATRKYTHILKSELSTPYGHRLADILVLLLLLLLLLLSSSSSLK